MAEAPSFPFKFGHVRVDPERLVLEQDNLRGKASSRLVGASANRSRLLMAVACVSLLWLGWKDMQRGDYGFGIITVAFVAMVIYFAIQHRDFTLTGVIERRTVSRVQPIRGIRFVTLDRLAVHLTEDGRPRRRFIMMPTLLQGGHSRQMDEAAHLLRDQGWPVDPPG